MNRTIKTANVRALNLYGLGTVMFPFERAAAPVAFQARFILNRLGEDGKPDNHRAYGTKSDGVFSTCADALKAESIILCEAPIDALSLAACGFEAVALGGTSTPAWITKALAFKRVYLAFDNDKNGAGDTAAAKLAPDLQSFGAIVTRLAPPREDAADKSDWNAVLLQVGAPALCDWLSERIETFQFEIKPEKWKSNSIFRDVPCKPIAETLPLETDARKYSEPAPTGKDTPCFSCGAYCGAAALCAFCG